MRVASPQRQRKQKVASGKRPQAHALLAWYDRHRRVLPWRAAAGEIADPYRVWLSEIMLQQTTVKAVAPYFLRFTARWPNVEVLAAAPLDDVLRAWAGLAYYARARNLHACARAVLERHDGQFPSSETELSALPASAATPRPRSRQLLIRARCRSMAMWSAWWRGSMLSTKRCRRRNLRSKGSHRRSPRERAAGILPKA
jgi:hypothetical protein